MQRLYNDTTYVIYVQIYYFGQCKRGKKGKGDKNSGGKCNKELQCQRSRSSNYSAVTFSQNLSKNSTDKK
jgi:hypothetical protein